MSIIRAPRPEGAEEFSFALDPNLTWAARGALAFAVATGSALTPDVLVRHAGHGRRKFGREAAIAIINELVEHGYAGLAGASTVIYLKKRIHEEIRQAVFARDGYRCVECQSIKRLCVDHITPERHGGSIEISNLRTLCRPCNSEKGDRPTVKK